MQKTKIKNRKHGKHRTHEQNFDDKKGKQKQRPQNKKSKVNIKSN